MTDDILTWEEEGDELLVMGLRLREGIDPDRFATLSGRRIQQRQIDELKKIGFVESLPNGNLRVTDKGWPVLDAVVAAEGRADVVQISGGEPTLHPDLFAILDEAKQRPIRHLMLNTNGEVAECTGDNIFLVKNGTLYTPPIDAGILEGITRNAVIELAEKAGITVRQIPLSRHDVYIADEVFLTGSAAEVIPVVEIDSRPSDALALSVHYEPHLPIYVDDEVLGEVT